MELSFNGFHQEVISFDGTVAIGDIVAISGNGQVAKASADADFIGVCVSKRDQLAGVQVYGTTELAYTGTAPALGYVGLVCAGNNAVKSASGGRKILVLSVDSSAGTLVAVL